jgi:hypothetical protein
MTDFSKYFLDGDHKFYSDNERAKSIAIGPSHGSHRSKEQSAKSRH